MGPQRPLFMVTADNQSVVAPEEVMPNVRVVNIAWIVFVNQSDIVMRGSLFPEDQFCDAETSKMHTIWKQKGKRSL